MTDGDLQDAIRALDGRPCGEPGSVIARRRADLLTSILDAIRERGGLFSWNGIAYREKPKGQLSRSLLWGGSGSRAPG